MKNLYLPYSDSSAKVGYSWTIYQIILPKVKRDVLLGMSKLGKNTVFVLKLFLNREKFVQCKEGDLFLKQKR